MAPFKAMDGAEQKLLEKFYCNEQVSTQKNLTCIHSFYLHTPPPALFFKSPRPCLSSNVIISRLKARLLIIVLYVALCLVSAPIHLCGHHFITFLVTEVKKINGNQITLLTERRQGQCLRFAEHHLSFKTFHFFLLFIFIIIYSTKPRAFPNTECGLASVFCRAKRVCHMAEEVGAPSRGAWCEACRAHCCQGRRTLAARLTL